ncbi:hypothetical protein BJ166DRAFT_542959 [Pestalotiopsis sp. NC0098]|nr:hypothetical protein BJ166DRAFT_542959 [Pestalotiopsis sp. NC0098]
MNHPMTSGRIPRFTLPPSLMSAYKKMSECDAAPEPAGFPLFPRLPAELRVQVWRCTFEPRVLELHHYGEPWNHFLMAEARWFSSCGNPAALSVCSESRREALAVYSVALPLGAGPRGGGNFKYNVRDDDGGGEFQTTTRPGRRLYMNPAADALVLLGADLAYGHLMRLFADVAALDPTGRGLKRLGLTITAWNRGWASAVRQSWCRAPFGDLDEFLVLIYGESRPPAMFRGGECALKRCAGMKLFLDCTAAAEEEKPESEPEPLKKAACKGCGKASKSIVYLDFVNSGWTQ